VTINDCIFHSYNDTEQSAITGENSMLTFSGTVQFINNSFGSSNYSSAAIFLSYTNKESKLSLNVTSGAFVHFRNNIGTYQAAALWLNKAAMNVGAGAIVTFSKNKAKNWGQISSSRWRHGAIMSTKFLIYIERNATLYTFRTIVPSKVELFIFSMAVIFIWKKML
jgi:hypothetical protein